MGGRVSERLVSVLTSTNRMTGLPGPGKVKHLHAVVTADDLVNRKFHLLHPNELWVADITEHPTREGKVYCCAVFDAFSRKIVGWSIDTVQSANLVVNALEIVIKNRNPAQGGIVHAEHGAQFTSWAFTNRIRQAVLMPSFSSVADALDDAIEKNRSGQACKSNYSTASDGKPGSSYQTQYSNTSRSSTTGKDGTPDWHTAHQTNTS
jgi:putative transposase